MFDKADKEKLIKFRDGLSQVVETVDELIEISDQEGEEIEKRSEEILGKFIIQILKVKTLGEDFK